MELFVGARQGGLNISETADLLEFSHATVLRVCREWCETQKAFSEQQFCWQKYLVNERSVEKVKANRKVTVMQIITHYNSGMQKSISVKPLSLGYSSRRQISLIHTLKSAVWVYIRLFQKYKTAQVHIVMKSSFIVRPLSRYGTTSSYTICIHIPMLYTYNCRKVFTTSEIMGEGCEGLILMWCEISILTHGEILH